MEKQRSFRVEAVVLRHADWGEADRLLTLYTREMGKLRAIAKGARKVHSRKAGHLEPFTHVRLLLASGRDLYLVTQADTVDAHMPLRQDLERTGYAAYVVELLDRFVYEEGENPATFRLLTETLSRIDVEPDPWLAVRYYEMRLLDALGFRPQLFHCANCEAQILPEDQYFAATQGGALCPRCGAGLPGARPVDVQTLKYLRHFQRSSYPAARHAKPNAAARRAVEEIMHYYLTFLLERALNSPEFIRSVRR